jgi:hypothetical protein
LADLIAVLSLFAFTYFHPPFGPLLMERAHIPIAANESGGGGPYAERALQHVPLLNGYGRHLNTEAFKADRRGILLQAEFAMSQIFTPDSFKFVRFT